MVGAKYWDQIVEGCLMPNMEKNVKVNKHSAIINTLDSLPWGNPQEDYL
jgi:hypothetical protein